MYKKDRVGKDTFKLLLTYLEGLRGAARKRAKQDAEEVVTLNGGFTKVMQIDKDSFCVRIHRLSASVFFHFFH